MTGARTTLAAPARIEGVGLFSGAHASAVIEPADLARPDMPAGIVFVRTGTAIPAIIAHLSTTPVHKAFAEMPARNTGLEADGVVVHTVEHILSALAGMGVTDAVVRTEGDELPIGDGSAEPFASAIASAGLAPIPDAEPSEPIRVRAPIRVERDGASVTIEPSETPEFVYRLDYGPASPIPPGEARWDGDPASFVRTVAPARTFCLRSEAEMMQSLGLFEHLSPADMLVFGPEGPIDNELRFPDEPARHKLLDLIGDLSLAGRPICARVVAERSGHAHNHEAAQRLVAAMRA